MLEIKELTKYYGKNLAVDQVTFTVPNGQVGVPFRAERIGKINDHQKHCRFIAVSG